MAETIPTETVDIVTAAHPEAQVSLEEKPRAEISPEVVFLPRWKQLNIPPLLLEVSLPSRPSPHISRDFRGGDFSSVTTVSVGIPLQPRHGRRLRLFAGPRLWFNPGENQK